MLLTILLASFSYFLPVRSSGKIQSVKLYGVLATIIMVPVSIGNSVWSRFYVIFPWLALSPILHHSYFKHSGTEEIMLVCNTDVRVIGVSIVSEAMGVNAIAQEECEE